MRGKYLIIIALFMLLPFRLPAAAESHDCYARLEGDTLRIGNDLMERAFIWNGGHLMTVSVTDKRTGKVLSSENPRPDFFSPSARPLGTGNLSVEDVAATAGHPAFKSARVEFALLVGGQDTLHVRREWRIFPDAPAMECRNFVRGHLSGRSEEVLDGVSFPGRHWRLRCVEFRDRTDIADNLVRVTDHLSYKRAWLDGNLLFASDGVNGGGYFLLREAPCTKRPGNGPSGDFCSDFGMVSAHGWGMDPEEVPVDGWREIYGTALGVYDGGELSALTSLRTYLKALSAHLAGRDEMIMLNTWGDRSRDAMMGEEFCLNELEKGAQLGITHFQMDDGWQTGRSPASALGEGSFEGIWDRSDYWYPDPKKFPRGLSPVVEKGRSLGIEPGLWFNPSNDNDLADWEKDADVIIGLHRDYDIRFFKIDGLRIGSKQAEDNLRSMFEKIRRETGGEVVINLDVTAGLRPGYFFMGEYGNIFLENRYTDFASYYPYRTLRNLWQLSSYVPPERLQIEFLNKWRNPDKYPSGDRFAPSGYDFSYIFATAMAAQPLAWFEASRLPGEAFGIAPLIRDYKAVMEEFHDGIILPVGDEPDGVAWTGFQSITDEYSGFLLVFREDSSESEAALRTWLPAGAVVRCNPVLGDCSGSFKAKVSQDGRIRIRLPRPNSFALLRYEVK